MSCSKEDLDKLEKLMQNIKDDAEKRFNEKVWPENPVHFGFKKERKGNNSKRPKPRKKKK